MAAGITPRPERLLWLDALRGIAVLCVLAFHFIHSYAHYCSSALPQPFPAPLGWPGVLLFFVISGFVITLSAERYMSAYAFLKNRFLRIYPLYAISAVFTMFWAACKNAGIESDPLILLKNLFLLQFLTDTPHINGIYWTLAVEAHFYILITLMLLFSSFLGQRPENPAPPQAEKLDPRPPVGQPRMTAMMLGWLMLSLALSPFPQLPLLPKLIMPEYAGFFVGGMLLYRIWQGTHRCIPALYFALALCLWNSYLWRGAGHAEIHLAITLLFLAFIRLPKLQHLRMLNPLIYTGTISYALYLFHVPMGLWIIRRFELNGWDYWAAVIFASTLAFGVAAIMTFRLEKPVRDFVKSLLHRAESCSIGLLINSSIKR